MGKKKNGTFLVASWKRVSNFTGKIEFDTKSSSLSSSCSFSFEYSTFHSSLVMPLFHSAFQTWNFIDNKYGANTFLSRNLREN
jgi:hypothetical protein